MGKEWDEEGYGRLQSSDRPEWKEWSSAHDMESLRIELRLDIGFPKLGDDTRVRGNMLQRG